MMSIGPCQVAEFGNARIFCFRHPMPRREQAPPMIGESVRYYPIYRQLKDILPVGGTVLDVGSKGRGIGLFHHAEFIGVDLSFPRTKEKYLIPIQGSVLNLPFCSRSFDVVVCSDVFEHLHEEDRTVALRELLRVARKGLVIGFPTGDAARTSDRFIAEMMRRRGRDLPHWLEEHLNNGPVDSERFEAELSVMKEWRFRCLENQSLRLGLFIARMESIRILKALSLMLGKYAPRVSAYFLCRLMDRRGPFARRIYTIRKH